MDPDCRVEEQAADWRDEMPDERYRTAIGRLIWQIGMAAVLALQLLVVLAIGKKVYMVQEVLVVMLLTAISVAAILLLSVAFVLLQEGIRRAFHSAMTGLLRLTGFAPRPVGPRGPIGHPPLHR
jgi:hypothetical protein